MGTGEPHIKIFNEIQIFYRLCMENGQTTKLDIHKNVTFTQSKKIDSHENS